MIHERVIRQKAEEEDWGKWHQYGALFLIVQNTGITFDVVQWRSDLLDSYHNRKSFKTEDEAFKYFEKRKEELDIIFKIQAGDEEVKKPTSLLLKA